MDGLREYQQQAIVRLRKSYASGRRAPLLVMPTGAGKTRCFTYMTQAARERGRRTLIIVHRQELLTQASRSLESYKVPHGLIAPGKNGERDQVAVASVQTLDRRLRNGSMDFDFIILDEAHHACASVWFRVLERFPSAQILGVTATPCRLDGKGLGLGSGGVFDDLVIGPQVSELIKLGFLVKPIVYAPPVAGLDLTGVRSVGGDYAAGALAERMMKPSITGCAVEHYSRLASGEPAIAFCASIAHAEHVTDQFRAAGYTSAVIHGGLDDHTRRSILEALAEGWIQVVTSVDLISEGTDVPAVAVGMLLRPTKSTSLFIQQVGRILRPSANKHRALVLDHVGNCMQHGLPDESRCWVLDGNQKPTLKSSPNEAPRVQQCKQCYAVWSKGSVCLECGHEVEVASREIEVRAGSLTEMSADVVARERERRMKRSEVGRAQSRADLEAIARARGYSAGWVFNMMKARQRRGVR